MAPLTSQGYVLVASERAAVTTLLELIAAERAKPGGLTFASTGVRTGTQLGTED